MATYLTRDKTRGRWVFQIRIPRDLRPYYDGMHVVRRHIGDVSRAFAADVALRRAKVWKAEFKRIRARMRSSECCKSNQTKRVTINLDAESCEQFIATWQALAVRAFEERLASMQIDQDADWHAFLEILRQEKFTALTAWQRADVTALRDAFSLVECRYDVQIRLEPGFENEMVPIFNSQRVALLGKCCAVVTGDCTLSSLKPAPEDQLPLVEIAGTPGNALVDRWQDRRLATGAHINRKTFDKYRKIGAEFATVLGRRPLEATTRNDVHMMISQWRHAGNGVDTVRSKCGTLKSLLSPFIQPERLAALFDICAAPRNHSPAKRLPFSAEQLGIFLRAVFGRDSVRQDDRMCVALLLLTGAHVEEVYQLRSEDLEQTGTGWTLRFVDRQAAGRGEGRLKTPACTRQLPIRMPHNIFPGLGVWLNDRKAAGGYVFAQASRNRYGIRSAAASQRLNRLIRTLFPDEPRLVLQSTRNTIGPELRRAGIDPRVRRRTLGHADKDIHDRHYEPGDLLSERDLAPAAQAIVTFLESSITAESTTQVEPISECDPEFVKHGASVIQVDFRSRTKQ